MKFLSNILATFIGLFLFFLILFFGTILIGTIAGGGSDSINVKENTVIELDLEKVTNDYAGKTNYKNFNYLEANHDGLIDILNAIKEAKTDDHIKGISILNNTTTLGIAQSKALRDELIEFQKSGKFVLAYANSFSQKEYYLNSIADTIYLNPMGELDFKGLSSEVIYYKDFQDKSGIKMEVIRHGKYKSAVEPYLANKMSDANREQISTLLNSVWNSIAKDISESRQISVDSLNSYANRLSARTPEMAKSKHLIDKIAYEDEYHAGIKTALKVDQKEDYNTIDMLEYADKVATTSKKIKTKDKIAIIYAQGTIASGEGDVDVIGEGSMRRSLKAAVKDDNIKAIVLRIDSPGGSALTSELIWREIELTKKKKPVIVSMGNLAASGGYYIACNANTIFAEPSTITGSIGVFGALPNFKGLTDKIGIYSEQVKTHNNASEYSVFKPLNENYREVVQQSIEKIYTTFINHVASGRKMTYEQVDSIAQGRVWTGLDAVKIGLVDKTGGLDDAIKEAASMVNIKTYKTENFPEYEKDLSDLLHKIPFLESKESSIKKEIGLENYRIIEQIRRLSNQQGAQLLLPFELTIN